MSHVYLHQIHKEQDMKEETQNGISEKATSLQHNLLLHQRMDSLFRPPLTLS